MAVDRCGFDIQGFCPHSLMLNRRAVRRDRRPAQAAASRGLVCTVRFD